MNTIKEPAVESNDLRTQKNISIMDQAQKDQLKHASVQSSVQEPLTTYGAETERIMEHPQQRVLPNLDASSIYLNSKGELEAGSITERKSIVNF